MERILLEYGTVIAITLAMVMTALRGDESFSRKWVKVHVRTDEGQSKGIREQARLSEQPEEEFDMGRALAFTIFGMMLLIFWLLGNV